VTGGQQVVRSETRYANFLPDQLRIHGSASSQIRKRGIFSIPVYELRITMEGRFSRPDFSNINVEPAAVIWHRAHLVVGIADVRAIQEVTSVNWNGSQVAFVPGVGAFADVHAGIHSVVGFPEESSAIEFALPLALNGSEAVNFAPFGESTLVELSSNYEHPSFQGNWLPSDRTVTTDGFSAKWAIPFLGRSFPQAWAAEDDMSKEIGGSLFGVKLLSSVDHYRMAERSVKYAGLFILLTFAALWLFEVLAGIRVHPIQYLMMGGALCLFYLLELSLSEHLGFPLAYAVASVAVVGMVAAYAAVVLRGVRRALGVGLGVALLYAYLYVLLMNEDFALLIGSIGLFLILAGIMFATRRVDWYSGRNPERK
jgi:inner membrane protein